MASWHTIDDVKRILRSAPPPGASYGRVKIGSTADDHLTALDATAFMDAVESEFVTRTGITPTAPVEKILTEILANLSAWQIYTKLLVAAGGSAAVPPVVQTWYDWAMGLIENILDGTLVVQPAAAADAAPQPRTNQEWRMWEEPVTLTDSSVTGRPITSQLTKESIREKSETVANDRAKTVKYVRGTDYEIFCDTGELRRIAGGAITAGQQVWIWYTYLEQRDFSPARRTRIWSSSEGYG